jgi:hypothetical protein
VGRGGLNLKKLLDDPPSKFVWADLEQKGVDPKYLTKAPQINTGSFTPLFNVLFGNPLDVAYAAWFN